MQWRLIPSSCEPTCGQMAYDSELFHGSAQGNSPLLRFFFFGHPTLTLGRLEARRLDLAALPYPHEIRPTGGRAVLHGEGDLCYSIVAPTNDPLVGGELLESYRKISALLAYALRGLGREVRLSDERHPGLGTGHCFSSPSFAELTLSGKKVAGGAQAREGNVFLQQGVILLSLDPAWEDLLSKGTKSPMTGLNEGGSSIPLTRMDVERAIVSAFEEAGVVFERHLAATGVGP
jgi:lipoyl(octanoyl) transferase